MNEKLGTTAVEINDHFNFSRGITASERTVVELGHGVPLIGEPFNEYE